MSNTFSNLFIFTMKEREGERDRKFLEQSSCMSFSATVVNYLFNFNRYN